MRKGSHGSLLRATMSFFKETMLVHAALTFLSAGFCCSLLNKTDIFLHPSLPPTVKKSVEAVIQNKNYGPMKTTASPLKAMLDVMKQHDF